MARKARVQFAGAVYHVIDRGGRREDIFRAPADQELFLETLGQACSRTGWRIHAWVLMSNHYHLLLETPQANLVAGMSWFQSTYTARFNRRYRLCGHLFQGRYKAVVVDPEERGYFAALSDYIHLNPVRARMITLDQRLFDYPWSSYRWFAATQGRREWFTPETVLGELGLADDPAGRRSYAERMRQRAVEELTGLSDSPARAELRRGWCLGGPAFRERMLALLDLAAHALSRYQQIDAPVRHTHDEEEAMQLLARGLEAFRLDPGDLPALPKGDPRKVALAALIRSRTTVPNYWLAGVLHLGHPSRIAKACRAARTNDSWQRTLHAAGL